MKFDGAKKWNENYVRLEETFSCTYSTSILPGSLETEIKKDELPIYDPEDNLDAHSICC